MTNILLLAVPLYVLLAIALGGSSQFVVGVGLLQIAALALIGWSVVGIGGNRPGGSTAVLLGVLIASALIVIVQIIPLPPTIWAALPGRVAVASGYDLLGLERPWLPISLTPYRTMDSGLYLLPPAAVILALMFRQRGDDMWIAASIVVGTMASVLLGVLQVFGSGGAASPWYLHEETSLGSAVGFFANSNHMGSLLVVSIPFVLALAKHLRDRNSAKGGLVAVTSTSLAAISVILIGVALNGSIAALLLAPPVTLASLAAVTPPEHRAFKPLLAAMFLTILLALALQLNPTILNIVAANNASLIERQEIWATTVEAIKAYFPWGSGVGSFIEIYPGYEHPDKTVRVFINNAHNDYLEIALEAGLLGGLIMSAFIIAWAQRTWSIWRSTLENYAARAASIASGALLVHSAVDYPLRTTSLAVIMAACLVLMFAGQRRATKPNIWPTRHLRV